MKKTSRFAVIEIVDNWHARWDSVLESIASHGQLDALMIDADGWLSARQVLLVAFAGGSIAGHLCFTIGPAMSPVGNVQMEASLDAFAVATGAQSAAVARALKSAAVKRAKNLRCLRVVGLVT